MPETPAKKTTRKAKKKSRCAVAMGRRGGLASAKARKEKRRGKVRPRKAKKTKNGQSLLQSLLF